MRKDLTRCISFRRRVTHDDPILARRGSAIAATSESGRLPSPQRFVAVRQSGHNADNDEAALGCHLDYVRMRELDGRWTLLFYAWSDPRSRVTFVGGLPSSHYPLKEGAKWTYNGKPYRYRRGIIESLNGAFRLEIDQMLMGPTSFEGVDPARPEHRLSCEF
jgi:hypothetical protein